MSITTVELSDGRVADIYSLTFGRARLGVRAADSLSYDDAW